MWSAAAFPPPPVASPEQRRLANCAAIHRELKSRKNVTLQLLWEEYKQASPLGYVYNWYCVLYRAWQHCLDVVMRQEHRAGEKTFVDHAGQTVPVTDPKTGRVRQAAVFVALLGTSYAYAEAAWSQNLCSRSGRRHGAIVERQQGVPVKGNNNGFLLKGKNCELWRRPGRSICNRSPLPPRSNGLRVHAMESGEAS